MAVGASQSNVLFDENGHTCIVFNHLVSGHGVQANQFLIIDGTHCALIDPGGDLTFTPLSIEVGKYIDISQLDYIFASHQDPDIIASLPRWLMRTQCKVVTSKLWSRFLPHLASNFVSQNFSSDMEERIIAMPDQGGFVPFGREKIQAVPAHFLHSVGNFQFFDPVSKILFSGDMGASLVEEGADEPVLSMKDHIPLMEGFHKRYMASNQVCRMWAQRVAAMDVEMIVPQHGKPIVGKAMIHQFLDWVSDLRCGIDLLTPQGFQI